MSDSSNSRFSNTTSDTDRSNTNTSDYSRNTSDSDNHDCSHSHSHSHSHSFAYSNDDDYSNEFYNDIVQTTRIARDKKYRGRRQPLVRTPYIEKVFDAVLSLTDDILDDWRDKVRKASSKGFSNVNIYEYTQGTKYMNFPVVMLMNGPKEDPDFFKNNGMFSVVEEIQNELGAERFRVEYKYVGNGKNVVNVDWRGGLFEER